MLLFFLVRQLLACEFDFTLNQSTNELQIDIQQAQFIAFGIWSRYYTFYIDQSEQSRTKQLEQTQIFRGFNTQSKTQILFQMFVSQSSIDHQISIWISDIMQSASFSYPTTYGLYEGIWIFLYIGFDNLSNKIQIFLVNTKTNEFQESSMIGQVDQIDSVVLYEQFDSSKEPLNIFSGQVSFTQSQQQSVNFVSGESLLTYLESCAPDYQCAQNSINKLISGILNIFQQSIKYKQVGNYWIDGWFLFTPLTSTEIYNKLILQIVQYDQEAFPYNGMIPLQIILSFDTINLENNGIIIETSSYISPRWYDQPLNNQKQSIFDTSYQQLLQNWVYFRFIQYDQIDHNAEFYLSFSDTKFIISNMGQINLFKYGQFFIYLGFSRLNPDGFLGQLANVNIQSCLTSYQEAKRACHYTCLTCAGPMDYNCLTCLDQAQSNRILNTLTNTCDCKIGFISAEGQIKCMDIQTILKSSSYGQFLIQQSTIQPCKDGQFQYQIGSQIKCYDCPQQSTQGILCADCIENLLTWQTIMKCSYDYHQANNNQDNTFIKYFRPQNQIDYYYIQDELLICNGCQIYQGGKQIVKDKTTLYGSCHENYYYNDSSCYPCQSNCQICFDLTGLCSQCETSFVLYNQVCQGCPDYCLNCLSTDQFTCIQCQQGYTPGNGLCQQCGTNCHNCEYDTEYNIPRCLACINSSYFLLSDGVNCALNTITKCIIQYQQFDSINTLVFNFKPQSTETIVNKCALCKTRYKNYGTYCNKETTIKSDEQVLDINGQSFYLISSSNPEYVQTDCNDDQCSQCLTVKGKLRCILCSQGFYANMFNGNCIACPSLQNCKTCQQQNKYYQDGWKWNIRAYFQHSFSMEFVDVASSIDVKDYEIICLTCNTGYMLYNNTCIQNCPINCKSCSIINGQNVCTFCGSNNYGKLLTNYNNQCSNCPYNCEFCQPRSQKDVYTINSLFNPDDASKYYYSYLCLKPSTDPNIFYNQFLQQYVKCSDGQFCNSQIIIKLKAHCDQQSYDNEIPKYDPQDFQYANVKILDVFANTTSHFQHIESPQFIEYLNVNQIVSLIYELTLMSSTDTCQITNFISTKVPRNVFSILENKLLINGNNLNLQSQGAQILNFSEVQIFQTKFYLPFWIKIFHPTNLIVSFKNINYKSSQTNDIDIILINPSQIEIQSFYIEAIEYFNTSSNNMISYQYTNSSTVTNLNIKMDNIQFIKSQFYSLDFLILVGDSKILSLVVNIQNSIIESTFYNSSFIKESTIVNKGQINLVNVTFIVQVYQASLISLNGQLNIECSIFLTGNFTSSDFLRTNQFYIFDSKISNTILYNSTLIDNKISKQDSQINVLKINNLTFNNIRFDNSSSLISIVDNNVQDQLIIQNIQMIDCEFMSKTKMKSSFRLIRFEGQTFQLLDSFFNKSIYGLTDISIKYCSSAIIQNVTVIGFNILGLQNKLECYEEQVSISQQNGFIQLENVQYIKFIDSQFNNIMIQNYPIIGIFCYDDSIEYEIQVINTSFKNNLILITELKSQGSVFQLLSPQPGNFTIFDVTFTENILNEYVQNQFQNSATTFLIEAEEFNVTFNNTLFNKNQMFNSSDSILYILAQVVVIQYSTFTKSNMYDDFILQFVIWGTTSTSYDFYQENLQEIFPIIAVGGNAKLVADTLLIGFCQFSYSSSQQGSGIHMTLQNLLQIVNVTFIGLKNILDQDDSQGGALYITLIAYNATLEIFNTIFDNTYSLYDGGAIYINSRYTTSIITLSQITVSNCYSLRGTFISVYLNKYSAITITNIIVKNDIQTFRYYLSQIYNITDNYVEQFHSSSAIFYIQYGSLYISNLIVSDISLSSVLYFYSAADLYLYNSVIQNMQFSALGLIQIYPTSNINTMIYIKNVQIINCNNVSPQQIPCQNKIVNYLTDFQCFNYNNKPTSLSSYPQDSQSKINCFQQRLLYFTSSTSMIYVDMVQISDYLYVSDLHIINSNCSLCKDGMISIKNIDINTPEFNNIIFEQVHFSNNSCGSGCLVVSQEQIINYPSRRQLSNILYSTRFDFPSTVTLEESEFINNTAQNGMVIVSNLSLLVIDDKFIKNKGSDISGGVLFLGNQNNTFNIMTSEFSDSIGNKGGALYLINKTISSPQLLQVLLSSNFAKSFGSDFVDTPQSLTISLDSGKTFLQTKYVAQTQIVIQEIIISPYRILGNNTLQQFVTLPSGYKIQNYQHYDEKLVSYIPYNLSLRIIPLNNLKQQIKNLQNTYCTIQGRKLNINNDQNIVQFSEQGLSITKIQFNVTTQDYNLDELIISFDPYLSYDYVLQLQFKCSSVQIPTINTSSPYNIISYSNDYELRMNIRTFKCQRGESYNVSSGTCNLCDSAQALYSVVIKASRCSVQDEITMKSVNSTHIELRQNYWRPYHDNNVVTYCFNLPVDCNGGWSPGDDSCALGHIGALCEQCDLYNIRGNGSYAVSGQFQCGSCADLSINTISIAFIMLWTLISIFLSVKGTVENVDELVVRMRGIKAGFVCVYFERVQIAVLMKILTNYLQIISSIGTFQLKLPPGLKDMFTYVGNPVKSMTYSLDCFLIELSNIPILYFRNLWSIFMPFYYSTIIFLIYLLILKIKTLKFNITVISTTLIYIFIYVQPDIIGGFISLLSYRKISQVLWVQGNVSYLYLTAAHARWLLSFVLPVLVVFGFLIPIILYRNMSKFKDQLDDTNVLRLYGYLYNEYSKVTYYWEILKIGQKELIIVFLIFYEDVIVIKGTLVFIIIFAYDIFSKSYKPYKRIDLNELDSQNSFVCAFSIVLGMAIYVADQSGNSEILWPFYLLMGIFNLYFIIRLITLLILGYLYKMTEQIDQIRDKINEKYPNIILQHPWLYRYLENSKIKTKRVKQRYLKLRDYLWKKALQNLAQRKNQKLEIEIEIDQDEQKELKDEFNNKELRNDVRKTQILPQDTPQVLIQNNRQKLPKLQLVDKTEEPQLNIPMIETPQVNNSRSEYGKLSNSYLPEQQPLTKNLLDKFETDQQYTSPQRKSSLELQQQQEDQKSQIINQSHQSIQVKQQINQESPNISIHRSQSNKKSKNQSHSRSGSNENNQEKVNKTLDIQQLNNEQALYENVESEKPPQDEVESIKKDNHSDSKPQENQEFENIQEFDFHFSELDFQNSKDNDEQQNLSFQQ